MAHQRVVITGVGIVSALGLGAPQHFESLLRGESGVAITTAPELRKSPAKLQARVKDFSRRKLIQDRSLRKLLSPSASYAVIAAGEAIRDAGLESGDISLQDCGLYVGSIAVDADIETFLPALRVSLSKERKFDISRFARYGMKLLDPLFIVKALPNSGLCAISIQHQILGPNVNITNGAVSGLQAVAVAAAAIRSGEVGMVVAGGYDSLLRVDIMASYLVNNRLSRRQTKPERACRPFDRERDGFAAGEGAAFFFLESESHARARSARIYGEILSFTHTTDGSAMLQRDNGRNGTALEAAARRALQKAVCSPANLGIIFGDGLATEEDDLREAAIIHRLVGNASIPFVASTGALGFTGAASGAFSLAHAMLALHHQMVPPLINCEQPDQACAVHFVAQPEERCYDRVLVWNSDCGVKNVAMLVGAYEADDATACLC
jgi:3-oxoacyl-[acyl-carrier-protein] synthase II